MAAHGMFLAMILTNAKREEACTLTLTAAQESASIEMQLFDGSKRSLSAPPPEVMTRIIESLAGGQRIFESSVFSVTVESVKVLRSAEGLTARISAWSITHR